MEFSFSEVTFVRGSVKTTVKLVAEVGDDGSSVYGNADWRNWLSILIMRVNVLRNMGFVVPCATGITYEFAIPTFFCFI